MHIEGLIFKKQLMVLYYLYLQVIELYFCFCYKQREQLRNIFHIRSLVKPEELLLQLCKSVNIFSLQAGKSSKEAFSKRQ